MLRLSGKWWRRASDDPSRRFWVQIVPPHEHWQEVGEHAHRYIEKQANADPVLWEGVALLTTPYDAPPETYYHCKSL